MKNYQDMLKAIMKSSGWTQQQLATRLGVSFPTINYWLNNKVTPRKNMQKRIRDLYMARNIPYDGPTYITMLLKNTSSHVSVGDKILLLKGDYGSIMNCAVVGIRDEDFDKDFPEDASDDYNTYMPVATAKDDIAKGTKSAFRIYNRIYPGAYAHVMFILKDYAIAVIEDFGVEV